ncbi:MAG: hypothetical protein GJT30_03570 [Geobacter sp.]|nr:hypothetical protein [Geobacter sp.]
MNLNYLPLHFSSDKFSGGILSFPGNRKEHTAKDSTLSIKLRELRQQYGATHFFHPIENAIACIGLNQDASLIGEKKQFNILDDFQLANALARTALFRFFTLTGYGTVIGFRPVTLLLEKHNLSSSRKDIFGIFPEYSLDIRPLAPHEGNITSGVLVGFGIRYTFLKTMAELNSEGIPLTGLYAVQMRNDGEILTSFDRRYLGRIEQIRNGVAILSDSDVDEAPLDSCYLEGSRTNVEVVGRAVLGDGYNAFNGALLEETFKVMGAEHQVQRLNKLGT